VLLKKSIDHVHCTALEFLNHRWIAGLKRAMGQAHGPETNAGSQNHKLHYILVEIEQGCFVRRALTMCIALLWNFSIIVGSQD
jgi:hypothetical protein